jgi:ribonuclease HI
MLGVFDGELFALTQAFKETATSLENFFYRYPNCPIRHVFIFTDSQSALKRINDLTNRPGQSLIHELTNHAKTITTKFKVTIHVEWVPAHLGIPGNERADRLADEVAKNEKNEYENVGYTSFTHLKVLARQSTLRD